ncbi:alpha/beta hydrolase family protein [Pleurocapsa sp. FMAR1]|uniref:alpha/beta hydrolase family protein n=1 Tax=Pleurocapsa sp. FMAR1 TaxID=3040204 RepID=UPI0029C6B71C|nr:hypothetical protein [Pleurocapsa sp. FMAR1]
MSNIKSLNIAGIPVIVSPPPNQDSPAPLIILWHGFDTPSSEAMLAKTMPLKEVQAWKAYPELPLFGHLMKAGNIEELTQRRLEDYLLQLLLPTIEPALQKLPEIVSQLQAELGIDPQLGIGLFGFSAGGITSLLTLIESSVNISAAVLIGVTKDMTSGIDMVERTTQQNYQTLKEQYSWIEERHKQYNWTEASRSAQQRLDFVERAAEIVQRKPIPAILLAHGVQDEIRTLEEAKTLYAALKTQYERAKQPELLSLKTFEHLKHRLDFEAAENNPQMHQDLIELQQVVARWFSQYLRQF